MANWTYDTGTFVSPTGERFDIDTEHGRERMLDMLNAFAGIPDPAAFVAAVREVDESRKALALPHDLYAVDRFHAALDRLAAMLKGDSNV